MWKNLADTTEIAEKRTVGEAIEKSLKDRDSEERDRQNIRKNIIIFGPPESKKNEPEERKEEDVKKEQTYQNICKREPIV